MVSIFRTPREGEPHIYRAVRTVIERYPVEGVMVSHKRAIKGQGATARVAEQRLDEAYKRYLVKTGEAPLSSLGLTKKALETTLGDYLVNTWLSKIRSHGKVQSNTLVRYQGTVAQHIIPYIGHIPIRLLTQENIETLLYITLPAKRKRRKVKGVFVETDIPLLGNSPMRKIYDILSQALTMAVADDTLIKSPMLSIPRIEKHEPTDEGLDKLTWLPNAVMGKLYGSIQAARWVLSFYGLRQSERLGVENSSFTYLNDPKKVTELKVNRQLERDAITGKLYIKYSTKTRAGKRIIPLPDDVTTILLAWKREQEEWKTLPSWNPPEGLEDLFFTTPTGQPIRHQTDNKQWHSLLSGLAAPDNNPYPQIRHHAMRHITATWLAKAGVHPEIAKTILGHSDALMTVFYTHLGVKDRIEPIEGLTNEVLERWRKKELDDGTEIIPAGSLDDFNKAMLDTPVEAVNAPAVI